MFHRLMHRLGLYLGEVVSAPDIRGTIWVGFRCFQCGKVEGIHASILDRPDPSKFRP